MFKKNKNRKQSFHTTESYQPHLQPIDKPKKHRLKKCLAWLKHHKKISVLLGLIFVLAVAGGIYAFINARDNTPTTATKKVKQKAIVVEKIYSPLTGAEVSKEDSLRPVTGVMVENSPEARPQSGIKDAGVVFESVAEGGITRFLLLYQEAKPSIIGPVRSVRPQFASWVAAFDAGLAHVGGSDIPLKKLRSGQIKDLDQFFNAGAYARVTNRAAPHNVYTSDEKLQSLNVAKKYTSSTFTPWKRSKKDAPSTAPTAKAITVPVSTGLFGVNYNWDTATNSYLRNEGGAPHNDREGGQLSPKVVIVMQVPHDVVRDSNNYSYPDVNTSGKAWIFQNGLVSEVSWKKTDDKSQIAFTDASGKPLELNAGQTWITAIRPDRVPAWQ